MNIQVLGSSSGEPVSHRNASAYLLTCQALKLLVDAGDGVAQQMARYGADPRDIDAILISHTHPDHVSGIFLLLQHMYILKRTRPLNIFLPDNVMSDFRNILSFFNIFPEMLSFRFNLTPIFQGEIFRKELLIRAIPNEHMTLYESYAAKYHIRPESYSFIMKHRNRSCLYTADIRDIESLRSEASNVDLLLSECAHVEPQGVLSFAESLDIKRVALTHILPSHEQQVRALRSDLIDIHMVHDGEIIEV